MKTIEPVCTIEPTSAAARQPAPKIRPTATAHASTKIRGHHLERLALVYIRLPGATQNLFSGDVEYLENPMGTNPPAFGDARNSD